MRETPRFNGYDETPIYTMKTVVQQTGITPTTLRAWERRYGILQPDRSDGGYRLYSEHDIAVLRWLKSQIEAGINIGRAVALLELRRHEMEIAPINGNTGNGARFKATPEPEVATARAETRTAEVMAEELLDVLLHFCETKASAILSEAFALHPVEVVAENIIVPALVEAGDRWHKGEIGVVQSNFVASFLRQKLVAMFAAYSQPPSGPLAVTGSAPGEWHDIGILLVSLSLRRQGWRVLYLGQNLPIEHLIADLPQLKPELVCLSATTYESAQRLMLGLEQLLEGSEQPPRLLLGGRAFDLHPELQGYFPDAYYGSTASEAVAALTAGS